MQIFYKPFSILSIARAEDRWSVAWTDERDGYDEINFTIADTPGVKLTTEISISNGIQDARWPFVV